MYYLLQYEIQATLSHFFCNQLQKRTENHFCLQSKVCILHFKKECIYIYIERSTKYCLVKCCNFVPLNFHQLFYYFFLKSPFIMRFVFIHAKMTFCFFSKLHLIPSNNNQITRLMTHDKASKVFRSKFFFVLSCKFTAFIIFLRPRTSKIQLIKIIIPKVCDAATYWLYTNKKIKN